MEQEKRSAVPDEFEQQAKHRFSQSGLGEQARIYVDDVVAVADDANEESDRIAKQSRHGLKRTGFVRPAPHDKVIGVDVVAQPGFQEIDEINDAAGNGRGSGQNQDPQRRSAFRHTVPLFGATAKIGRRNLDAPV
jgi:hypothetical protein